MKRIPLTQGKFALVDDEDYDWLMTWNWYAKKGGNTFYAATNIPLADGRGAIKMHRLLMMHPKGMDIDHDNHEGLDNQKHNLITCTHRHNMSNLRKQGSSQYTGVNWHKQKGKWQSRFTANGKTKHLGLFPLDKEYEAHLMYLAAVSQVL